MKAEKSGKDWKVKMVEKKEVERDGTIRVQDEMGTEKETMKTGPENLDMIRRKGRDVG